MKYCIEKQDTGRSIRIEGVTGQEQPLIDAVHQCRQSVWACLSGERRNIGTIGERAEEEAVFLTLTPRSGVQLDPLSIEECLCYTLHHAVKV